MSLENVRRSIPGLYRVTQALPLFALLVLAGTARADQDVQSSDGQWKLHAKISDTVVVKKPAQAIVDITPAGTAKGCPSLSSVVFEMPAHGHGGDIAPQSMDMGKCQFHISDLSASMGGAWRLRLVLKSGDKTSNADFAVTAK